MTAVAGMMKRIQLRPEFPNMLARHGMSIADFVRISGVAKATIFGLLNPSTQEGRVGGMMRTTAWRIVNAFASQVGISPDEAWPLLLEEVEVASKPRSRKGDTGEE